MVQSCSEIVSPVVEDLYCQFTTLKSSPYAECAWDNFERKLLSYRDPFSHLVNTYQQTAHMKQLGVLVPPDEYTIARSQAFTYDKIAKFCKPVLHEVTGQHISIRKMLMALNEHIDLVKNAVHLPHSNEDRYT
jgi:hypothetical protein